jgi:hypothetical protein
MIDINQMIGIEQIYIAHDIRFNEHEHVFFISQF